MLLRIIIGITVFWVLAEATVLNVFMTHEYDCSKGSTNCRQEKIWKWK